MNEHCEQRMQEPPGIRLLHKDPEISGIYQEGPDGTYPQELSFGFDVSEGLHILTAYCSSDR